MDTTAYLTRQGWRGHGHSLDAHGRGIRKPLLVSKKNNAYGVGKRKHEALANQWWNAAFEKSLKGISIGVKPEEDVNKRNEIARKDQALDMRENETLRTKWGGLYSGFVKGDTLSGSMARQPTLQKVEDGRTDEVGKSKEARREKRRGDWRRDKTLDSGPEAPSSANTNQTDASVATKPAKKMKSKRRDLPAVATEQESISDGADPEKPEAKRKKKKKKRKKKGSGEVHAASL
jgi:hypothetical protein